MRLWSIHPKYLDSKGLVALWREGLLAQAVLAGRTKGYRSHPQLLRFLQTPAPQAYIAAYLKAVLDESLGRGYRFDERKIGTGPAASPLLLTRGQLDYEWSHLKAKLRIRAPEWLRNFEHLEQPVPHPIFQLIDGGISLWEIVSY